MYPPQLIVTYQDGRRILQFAAPTALDDIPTDIYFHVSLAARCEHGLPP